MTYDERNIVLAEIFGWKRHEKHPEIFFHPTEQGARAAINSRTHKLRTSMRLLSRPGIELLPDYLNDLDEIRRIEVRLTDDEYYIHYKRELSKTTHSDVSLAKHFRQFHSATATERGDAIIRALGRWVDRPPEVPVLAP